MYFQSLVKRCIAVVMSTLFLVCSIGTTLYSVPVYAASPNMNMAVKFADVILNKAGVVASEQSLEDFMSYTWELLKIDFDYIVNSLVTTYNLRGTDYNSVDEYYDALIDLADSYSNNPEYQEVFENWRDLFGQSYNRFMKALAIYAMDSLPDFLDKYIAWFFIWLGVEFDEDDPSVVAMKIQFPEEINNKLKGKDIRIPGSVVNKVKKLVDSWIEEYAGYYIVKTYSVNDIVPSAFSTRALYDAVVQIMRDYPDSVIYFRYGTTANYGNYIEAAQLSAPYFVLLSDSGSYIDFYAYDSNWEKTSLPRFESDVPGYRLTTIKYWLAKYDSENVILIENGFDSLIYSNRGYEYFLCSVNVESIKVFKSIEGMKNYDTGRQDFYYNTNYTSYDSSIDNSFDVGGDYIIDNSSSITYDIVNDIITNNYYDGITEEQLQNILDAVLSSLGYSDGGVVGGPSGGNTSDGNSSSGEAWQGSGDVGASLNNFFAYIDSLLKTVVNFVGDLYESIVSLLQDLNVFIGSVSEFLKVNFNWIPQEIWDVILLGIVAIVIIGIARSFGK